MSTKHMVHADSFTPRTGAAGKEREKIVLARGGMGATGRAWTREVIRTGHIRVKVVEKVIPEKTIFY